MPLAARFRLLAAFAAKGGSRASSILPMVSARWRPWLWSAAIWYGFGVIDAVQSMVSMHAEGMHHPWLRLFWVTVVNWTPWLVATPLVMALESRLAGSVWRLPVHVTFCATVAFAFCMWSAMLVVRLDPYGRTEPKQPYWHNVRWHFLEGVVSFLVLYGAILAVNAVLESRARLLRERAATAQLNEQLSKAQLDAVRRQIEPHFLFNTLNAVSSLVRAQRHEDAVKVIAELSEFLRRVLEESERQEVPLREEMEFGERYLWIQEVRFEDRLRVKVAVSAEAMEAKVPTLMVQTLLENAIKHGIAKRAHGGEVRVSAVCENGALVLRVGNDGPALAEGWATGGGIGLANLRARLQSLYGEHYSLQVADSAHGVEVEVKVPLVRTACV